MASLNVVERVQVALDNNDEVSLRQIYSDLCARVQLSSFVSNQKFFARVGAGLARNFDAEAYIPERAKGDKTKSCVALWFPEKARKIENLFSELFRYWNDATHFKNHASVE